MQPASPTRQVLAGPVRCHMHVACSMCSYPALAALVLIYGGCAAFAFSRAAAIAREAPTPFSATIAEFVR